MLQLHKTESEDGHSAQEYAEFMHAPRKRFTDYGEFASSESLRSARYGGACGQEPDTLRCMRIWSTLDIL